ncbi:DUF4194 domain-containing protein [Chitinophaga nivalis]|uniref:DUF4194 domain-containing protein n=1 Tax=Chitinophaga nivalis TaxID=2991709 RepID=A0ABT3IPL9_9BACT|nr:DUF4194 domain-containing protein [Chitinophaga nivalis]MCW3464387.1 DUF4194 domain-containing protein [Chitinophaga nivalis]MCW3485922.1 DUF4194 domain-containing protein [Chitinophaga nivalis]
MEHEYALSLIALLKGIVYNHQKEVWDNLLRYEPDVKKYFLPVRLELFLDKSEGYAFLRQKESSEDEELLPRLTEKRQLNFLTSLLCVVLRKFLLEHDAQCGSVRSIISEQEIVSRTMVYLPTTHDEAKQQEKIITTINKVLEIGFLRKMEDQEKNYEIHRIIKGFVNADIVDETLRKFQRYAEEKKVTD